VSKAIVLLVSPEWIISPETLTLDENIAPLAIVVEASVIVNLAVPPVVKVCVSVPKLILLLVSPV